jgi:hypothetical protein
MWGIGKEGVNKRNKMREGERKQPHILENIYLSAVMDRNILMLCLR